MFIFEAIDIDNVLVEDYEKYTNKNLFCTVRWLKFLKQWRKVEPIIIRITEDDKKPVGYFTAGLFSKMGFKVIGSPFYGWMGQHMGFDFADEGEVDKSVLFDETIDFIRKILKPSFIIFADFKFSKQDIEHCKTELFFDTERYSYFLDLTQSEEQIFKNFKSGYRTCVRKFERLGGTIVEDYSDEFIDINHRQLAEVFGRKGMTPPNYRDRMKMLYHKYKDMVLSIKALDGNGKCIASSYYVGGGTLAFFASNASVTQMLKYNANQALMWYAIRYWKNSGIRTMDLAGDADYKSNFGSVLMGTPTVVWAKHRWEYRLVVWLRDTYYSTFRVKYKLRTLLHKKQSSKGEDPTN